jgi:hypothetical protein
VQTQGSAPPAGGEDPYAACKFTCSKHLESDVLTTLPGGGYNAYVALWYQAVAQGNQQPDMAKPPGTS